MRVALVHEWLELYAGAEKVLEQMVKLYPQADVYALVDFMPPAQRGFLRGKRVATTFIQWLPLARRFFRYYLFLFPLAMECLDLAGYDLIVSSSHCVAKNVRVRPGQVHVCYCHTPMRYAWDMRDDYLANNTGRNVRGLLLRAVLVPVLAALRRWDKHTAARPTAFVANSAFIAGRIKACYGRKAEVIHPPVAIDGFKPAGRKKPFYLTASRLVPYKKIALIAEAFRRMPERELVVIGAGPEAGKIAAIAHDAPNVSYLGRQPFKVLCRHMQQARAFVFAAQEDFGITPVEAMACGTPVIAYGVGGIKDSVVPYPAKEATGLFFDAQTPEAIMAAVAAFERHKAGFSVQACRRRAEMFSERDFRRRMAACVKKIMAGAGQKPKRK